MRAYFTKPLIQELVRLYHSRDVSGAAIAKAIFPSSTAAAGSVSIFILVMVTSAMTRSKVVIALGVLSFGLGMAYLHEQGTG